MIYPRWVYSINELVTTNNMKKYEDMKAKWEAKRDELYPNYFKEPFHERVRISKIIDNIMGYRLD